MLKEGKKKSRPGSADNQFKMSKIIKHIKRNKDSEDSESNKDQKVKESPRKTRHEIPMPGRESPHNLSGLKLPLEDSRPSMEPSMESTPLDFSVS